VDRIVTFSFRDKVKLGHADLESLEIHIRSSMHSVGSVMLEKLLNSDGGDYQGRTQPCEKGHVFEFKEYRDKKVLTVLGSITLRRAYYYDERCKKGYCPKDTALDIEGNVGSKTTWQLKLKRARCFFLCPRFLSPLCLPAKMLQQKGPRHRGQ
jgi:hypothetical protein